VDLLDAPRATSTGHGYVHRPGAQAARRLTRRPSAQCRPPAEGHAQIVQDYYGTPTAPPVFSDSSYRHRHCMRRTLFVELPTELEVLVVLHVDATFLFLVLHSTANRL